MARPDDSAMAIAAQRALRLEALPQIMARRVLHEAPGRAAERVEMDLVTVAVKWRDDRTQDREALLYADLAPTVLQALGAPRMLGATTMAASHLLFLEWVEGTPANWEDPEHVQLAFGHLGRVHAITARLLAGPPEGAATAAAWAELFPDPYMVGARNEEPLVLDPGDLHADNFLMLGYGGVCLLDFENMAVRSRVRALRQLRNDASMPQGELADLALSAYWAAAGWPEDIAAFRARLFPR